MVAQEVVARFRRLLMSVPAAWRRRSGLSLATAIVLGLSMVGIVLALNNAPVFHANAEELDQGLAVSGSHADTPSDDGVYRVLREEFAGSREGTDGDTLSAPALTATHVSMVNFTPCTMPAEGGFVHRIGIYVFHLGATRFRLALYDDSEGLPRMLLAQSAPLTVTDVLTQPGWLWFDVAPQQLPGNTRYWLAYQADNSNALLGWRYLSAGQSDLGYRFCSWSWGSFPTLAGTTWGPQLRRTYYQVVYTTTNYALDASYAVPVSPALDAYTLTVRAASSGEPFSVTADGQVVGTIAYSPTTRYFFTDDMESGTGNWTSSGFYHIVTDSTHYHSPVHTWWTDDVRYGSSASLTSEPIPLPFNGSELELRFWHRMLAEFNWDGGWLEYRLRDENDNWSDWSLLSQAMFLLGGYNSSQPLSHVPSGPHWGWTGALSTEVRIAVPITAAGYDIQWRWTFECDVIGSEYPAHPNGWWIDDVRMVGESAGDTELTFSISPSLAADGQVLVRFQDTLTNTYADLLGIDQIEIGAILYNRPPTVTVAAPNGGEVWDGVRTVGWSGADINGELVTYTVYASTDGGSSWSASLYEASYVESAAPVTHTWTGFDTTALADSQNCLLRVHATDGDADAQDDGDAVFAIDNSAPAVSLGAPTGGELLAGGEVLTVTWSASDAHWGSGPITLTYSTDGGASYAHVIAAGTANDGAHGWTVPALDSATVRVRVEAVDELGHRGTDESGDFGVDSTAPELDGETPAHGSTVFSGTHVISATLSDALSGIDGASIRMVVDGAVVSATYEGASGIVTYWPAPALSNAEHSVSLTAQDRVGNANGWAWSFGVDEPPAQVSMAAERTTLIANGVSTTTVTATVRSQSGHLVADGVTVVLTTTAGTLGGSSVLTTTTRSGSAVVVLTAATEDGVAVVAARAGLARAQVEIWFKWLCLYIPLVSR